MYLQGFFQTTWKILPLAEFAAQHWQKLCYLVLFHSIPSMHLAFNTSSYMYNALPAWLFYTTKRVDGILCFSDMGVVYASFASFSMCKRQCWIMMVWCALVTFSSQEVNESLFQDRLQTLTQIHNITKHKNKVSSQMIFTFL